MASLILALGLATPCLQPHLTRNTNLVVSTRASPVCARLCERLGGLEVDVRTALLHLPMEQTGIHSEHAAKCLRTSAGVSQGSNRGLHRQGEGAWH